MPSPSASSSTRQRLDVYRKRRDFKATPEPAPKAVDSVRGDRFVIQLHHARHRHFDFRLQVGGALRSWAVPKGPSLDPKQKRLAVEVEDHPLEYGKFQGAIPEGHYGAGEVWIWDEGRWVPEGDAAKALKKGHLDFELFGSRMKGRWSLIRTGMTGKRPQWLLFKRSDEHVKKGDVADDTPLDQWKGPAPKRSAVGRKSPKAAPRSAFPAQVGLQLARLVDKAQEGADWLHEMKYDGYRVLLLRNGRKLEIRSRGGLEWSAQLPHLKKAVLALPCKSCILDGEVVALDEQGRSRFDLLQRDFGEPQAAQALVAMLFDLLYLDGQDWRPLPQELRKEALQKLLQKSADCLRLSEYLEGHGAKAAKAACSAGLEGIVSKDRKAPYREGRGGSWVKTKCVDADEFAVIGYTPGQRSREALGALLLAQPEGKGWRYVGRVGTGFSGEMIAELLKRMRPVKQAVELPNPPSRADLRGARPVWVKPALVLEVEHRGRTGEGLLRQASLKALRADKSVDDLKQPDRAPRIAAGGTPVKQTATRGRIAAAPAPSGVVKLTHPGRKLFQEPAISKQDLADFYSEIAEWILPELHRRPLALLRCPDGAGKTCFFQKRATPGFPGSVHQARGEPYLWIEDVDGLMGMVQMGVLELHAWGATVDDIEHPDRVVFDLDPGEGVAWRRVIAAARLLRERLEQLGLQSFVRTSGGKGLHVVLPLQPQAGWDTVKNFTHALAQMLAKEQPDEFIATASKARRKGRIYIDYLRNGRGATAVASYTLRARPGAPAAVPLDWSELSRLKSPAQFGYANLRQRLKRLRRDPWEGFRELQQRLPQLH